MAEDNNKKQTSLRGGTTRQSASLEHATDRLPHSAGNDEHETSLRGTKQSAQSKTLPLLPKLRFKEFDGEWKRKKLGEVAKIITGSTPSTANEEYYNGEKLFISPSDIQANRFVFETKTTLTQLGFSKGRKVRKGSVLFVCIGSTIGKVAQSTEECLTNQQINALEAFKEYSNEFLYGILEKNGIKIKLLAGVQAVPQINKTDFSNFKYLFPSLPEQQKIASFLSAVDEKIQQLSKKKALLEQYKKGVMQQLFSGKLRFKDENGEDFPDWEEKRLGELAERNANKNKENKVNFVLTNSATQGIVSQSDYFDRDIANQNNLTGYYIVELNDFIYNPRISVHAPVGPIKRNKLQQGVMSPLYSVFKFKVENLEYFEYYFETVNWHRYLENVSNMGARHDRMNITNVDFFKMPIPFPCEGEREKIANYLSAIDTKIETVHQQIEKTQSFKKGLLQQMFV
ncbi:type I restriction enzyme S subunit [Maribacter caenipelagi]|uniref:Type I restriction enzyme S subunit n=1 Tax=Maribacter caenipelagi TaxID=1447781 RepID=A0A4R7DB29_9FLAO|nr:restriction endonuclease subunit S [Maribacter caenipelagi]TDS18569.1 type I restriction enzyme S subunit [Maribacter caenipelagi]